MTTIGGHDLEQAVLVIAEIGNNHEGSLALAEELIGRAAEAGADAVKFQTIDPDKLVSPLQTERIAQLSRFQLGDQAWPRLEAVARSAGVLFLSTPFSLRAVGLLDPLVPAFKVASGDLDYVALLEAVAERAKPLLVSTGMATMDEIRRAQSIIEAVWARDGIDPGLVLLHCVVSYPTAPADANLGAIRDLAGLGVTVGYSDHTLGTDAAATAVAMGCRVVEKHFTLDKQQSEFRDHQLSADPAEMSLLVERVRLVEELVGRGGKRMLPVEAGVRDQVRRGATAAADLPSGHVLEREDLDFVRPATGMGPSQEDRLVGHRLVDDIARGDPLLPETVEPI